MLVYMSIPCTVMAVLAYTESQLQCWFIPCKHAYVTWRSKNLIEPSEVIAWLYSVSETGNGSSNWDDNS